MDLLPLRADGNISQVVEAYKSTVYGIALTRTKNRGDADDVFQDVFLAYYRKQPVFNEEEHRKAWLIKTTLNCSKKLVNGKPKDTVRLTEELSDTLFEFQADEDTSVYASLCSLPEKYRTALYLYYFEELNAREIAELLHTRPGTVRMQLTRGRELMREMLKGEFA